MLADEAPDPVHLAARLSARIVHDLAGAAQGLANAVALAQAGQGAGDQEAALHLAEQVSAELGGRLAFCRAAYAGAGVGDSAQVQALLEAVQPRRASLTIEHDDPEAPDALLRLALLLGQICGQAVASGGHTRLRLERRDVDWRLSLEAEGPRVRPDTTAIEALQGRCGSGHAGLWALGALARGLVEAGGGTLVAEADPLRIEVRLPAG